MSDEREQWNAAVRLQHRTAAELDALSLDEVDRFIDLANAAIEALDDAARALRAPCSRGLPSDLSVNEIFGQHSCPLPATRRLYGRRDVAFLARSAVSLPERAFICGRPGCGSRNARPSRGGRSPF